MGKKKKQNKSEPTPWRKTTVGRVSLSILTISLVGFSGWVVLGAVGVITHPWFDVTPWVPGGDGRIVTTGVQFTIVDSINENQGLSGLDVSIYDTQWNSKETGLSSTNGVYTSSTYGYTSDITYYVVGGNLTSGRYLSEYWSFVMPRTEDASTPTNIPLTTTFNFRPVAEESEVTITIMRLGAVVTDYNHTTNGDNMDLSVQFQIGTSERCLRGVWDAGEKLMEELMFTMVITNSASATSQAADVSGISYTQKGLTSTQLVVCKRVSDFYYDVDSQGAVIAGKDGLLVIPISIDWGSCGLSATVSQTDFIITWSLTIGTTPGDYCGSGMPDSDNVFQDTSTFNILS